MDPTQVGIQLLLGFFGTVGTAIKGILSLSPRTTKVVVKFGLEPELENLIRDLIPADEEPVDYWVRAIRELIAHEEEKFRTLVSLGVTDVAIGTEAIITQPPNEVSNKIAQIAGQYITRYVLAPVVDEGAQSSIPPSSLADAFAIAADAHSGESSIIKKALDSMGRAKPL
jgi:hypothetical protein